MNGHRPRLAPIGRDIAGHILRAPKSSLLREILRFRPDYSILYFFVKYRTLGVRVQETQPSPLLRAHCQICPNREVEYNFTAQKRSLKFSMANKQHTLQSEQALPRGLINQQTGGACQAMPAHIRQRYEEIAQDRRYQHFVRIPPRIVRCL